MKTSAFSAALWAYGFIHLTNAVPWIEPEATPTGYMNIIGFSPMPTQPPGIPAGVPKELLKRQSSSIPDNWCGFVNGNVDDVLSCDEAFTCVYSSTAVGCCGAGLIQTCTALFTTCSNLADPCGAACSTNNKVLKCTEASEPYCAIYTFAKGKINYNCASISGVVSSVAFISDVLATLSGGYGANQGPITITGASQVLGGGQTYTSGSSFPAITGPATSAAKAAAISIGAIVGIAFGAIILLGAIAIGIFVFCCLKRRKRRNNTPVAATQPPMAHQPAPSTYTNGQGGSYAPVPQGPSPGQFNQQQTGYFPPSQQQAQFPAGAAAAYYDPSKPQDIPPQYSQTEGYNAARDSVFKAPQSPPPAHNATEIGGTPVIGQEPSRVASPALTAVSSPSTTTPYNNMSAQAGPVYEMPQSDHR